MSYFPHYFLFYGPWDTLRCSTTVAYNRVEILDKAKFAGENKFYNINAKHFIYLFFLILWKRTRTF